MTDWKGIAMVVNQLSQLAEPSKLDLLEREYEMKSVENEADRQHTFLLKAYETKENQLSKLQTQYETILKEGEDTGAVYTGAVVVNVTELEVNAGAIGTEGIVSVPEISLGNAAVLSDNNFCISFDIGDSLATIISDSLFFM